LRERVAYPIALAEKLARIPINAPSAPDIIVTINNNVRWYYGFENPENIRNGEFDLATVMLHEITHGLGFTGLIQISNGFGTMKFNFDDNIQETSPVIFGLYFTNGAGQNLCRTFENQSTRLGNALLSNNIFIQTPKYEVGTAPRIFAPTTNQPGSSFSHLNTITYQNTDDALMLPQIGSASSIHDLGISLDILHDIGWSSTHLLHQGIALSDDLNTPLELTATVASDLGYDANSVTLYVSQVRLTNITSR